MTDNERRGALDCVLGMMPVDAVVRRNGHAVVRRDGSNLDAGHAAVRVLTLPLSLLVLGAGLLGIVVGREHRALHDILADTAVVYAWDARAARLRFLALARR